MSDTLNDLLRELKAINCKLIKIEPAPKSVTIIYEALDNSMEFSITSESLKNIVDAMFYQRMAIYKRKKITITFKELEHA
jgi:hypothetical protein